VALARGVDQDVKRIEPGVQLGGKDGDAGFGHDIAETRESTSRVTGAGQGDAVAVTKDQLGAAICEYVCTGKSNSTSSTADQNPQVSIRGAAAHRARVPRAPFPAENSKENGPPGAD